MRLIEVVHCPKCGSEMTLKNPRPDQDWKSFWSCNQYPKCKGVILQSALKEEQDTIDDYESNWWAQPPMGLR